MDQAAKPGSEEGRAPTRSDLLARLAAIEGKLASLAAIERAKGALMVTYGLSADAAFALLRFHSQKRNVKIRALADELGSLMSTSPTTSEGITRFDRLLDEIALSLQSRAASPFIDSDDPATASEAVDAWPQLGAGELSEVMLRSVATAPPGITIAANATDLPLVYANDAFANLTGYTVGDVLGRNCRFLQGDATDPRDVAKLRRAMSDGSDISVVVRNYRSDGAEFWNEVSISPIRNRTEQITHYVGTQIDVSERIDRKTHVTPMR